MYRFKTVQWRITFRKSSTVQVQERRFQELRIKGLLTPSDCACDLGSPHAFELIESI